MESPTLSRGGPSATSNRVIHTIPEVSYTTPEVAPELWAIIASFSSRQSVARLCSVSREFSATFSAILYANIIDPPLTTAQSARLIRTLRAQTVARPHPAALIRKLGLTDGGRTNKATFKAQTKAATDSLKNLYLLIPESEPRGSSLRVLHWNMAAGLNELGQIIGAPGNFPNLRELTVSSDPNTNSNFDFIAISGLEVLGLNIRFTEFYENDSRVGDKLCLKLAEAMQMLPNHSPLLHTLLLKLHIPYDQQIFPHSGLSELVSAINLMCLPVLATHEISVDVKPNEIEDYDYYSDLDLPCTNFSAFLANHPNLAALTLSARGTELMEDVAFLPRLRSFKGSFKECAVICARQRQLEQLAITFVHPYYSFYNKLASFHTLPLSSHPALTKLHVLAVDAAGSVFVKPNELSPASFAQLVSSFPNLTHVDVCINKPMSQYRKYLGILANLQNLRLQEYKVSPNRSTNITRIFPPTYYITEIRQILPFLPHLAHIEICLFADYGSPDYSDDSAEESCSCCRRGFLSDMKADYAFSVIRAVGGAHVVLNGDCTFR